MKTPT